jgi:hypothetical protein
MKLKEQYLNALIYLPIERRDILGKFIDPRLYPYLSGKYPELFDVEEVQSKKSIKNDIRINDSKFNANNDDTTKSSIVSDK